MKTAFYFAIASALTLTACNDFLTRDPLDEITDKAEFWDVESNIRTAVYDEYTTYFPGYRSNQCCRLDGRQRTAKSNILHKGCACSYRLIKLELQRFARHQRAHQSHQQFPLEHRGTRTLVGCCTFLARHGVCQVGQSLWRCTLL